MKLSKDNFRIKIIKNHFSRNYFKITFSGISLITISIRLTLESFTNEIIIRIIYK